MKKGGRGRGSVEDVRRAGKEGMDLCIGLSKYWRRDSTLDKIEKLLPQA